MRYYCSVPDWEEYESATAEADDEEESEPSFLRESTTDTDLLTDGGR